MQCWSAVNEFDAPVTRSRGQRLHYYGGLVLLLFEVRRLLYAGCYTRTIVGVAVGCKFPVLAR